VTKLVIKVLSAMRVPEVDVRDVIQVHRRYLGRADADVARLQGRTRHEFDLTLALVVDASCSAWIR